MNFVHNFFNTSCGDFEMDYQDTQKIIADRKLVVVVLQSEPWLCWESSLHELVADDIEYTRRYNVRYQQRLAKLRSKQRAKRQDKQLRLFKAQELKRQRQLSLWRKQEARELMRTQAEIDAKMREFWVDKGIQVSLPGTVLRIEDNHISYRVE